MSKILPVVGEIFNMSNVCDGTGGSVGGWPGGRVTIPIIIPLRGPSCKLRFSRISERLKFQDEPSVATSSMEDNLQWMTTPNGRQHPMVDNFEWKMTSGER